MNESNICLQDKSFKSKHWYIKLIDDINQFTQDISASIAANKKHGLKLPFDDTSSKWIVIKKKNIIDSRQHDSILTDVKANTITDDNDCMNSRKVE